MGDYRMTEALHDAKRAHLALAQAYERAGVVHTAVARVCGEDSAAERAALASEMGALNARRNMGALIALLAPVVAAQWDVAFVALALECAQDDATRLAAHYAMVYAALEEMKASAPLTPAQAGALISARLALTYRSLRDEPESTVSALRLLAEADLRTVSDEVHSASLATQE